MAVLKNILLNWIAPLVLALAVLEVVQTFRRPDVAVEAGGLAPDFALHDTDGKVVRLSELRGRPVLVNFWGTWCGPCRAELPGLASFARKHPEVTVLGLAVDSGSWRQLARSRKELDIPFTVLESESAVSRAWGVSVLPTTFLVDADGHVAQSHVGILTPLRLGRWLR